MSHTRRDNRRFKRKERNRTGSGDPLKVRLHRERVIKNIEARSRVHSGYAHLIFQLGLEYHPENGTTDLVVQGEVVEQFSYPVQDPSDIQWRIQSDSPDFNETAEHAHLIDHVMRMKNKKMPCHLERRNGAVTACASVIGGCPFRVWRSELGLPECTKSQ